MTSELVTGMLRVVEGCDREEGEIRLVTEIFPPFADLFKQIWGADKAFALQCMQHYTSWLEGPPNRPTEDEVRDGVTKGSHCRRPHPRLRPCSACNANAGERNLTDYVCCRELGLH